VTYWQTTQLGIATAFAAIFAVLAVLQPDGEDLRLPLRDEPLPELCRRRQTTGEPCGSCGLTRGMVAAIRLDDDAAKAWHPSSIPMLVLIVAQVLGRLALATRRLRGPRTLIIGAIDFTVHAVIVATLLDLW